MAVLYDSTLAETLRASARLRKISLSTSSAVAHASAKAQAVCANPFDSGKIDVSMSGHLHLLVALSGSLASEPLPWCFSPEAPASIEGRWQPASAAPRAARSESERFHAIVAQAPRDAWAKDAARVCAAAPPYALLWSPTNCRLRTTRALAHAQAFENRSVTLIGDSLLDQLRRLLGAVNDAEQLGLRVQHARRAHSSRTSFISLDQASPPAAQHGLAP